MEKKKNTIMVFKKATDGTIEHISIESLGEIGNKFTTNSTKTATNSTKTTDKKTTTIKISKSQFICTYLTDDTLIDFLMETDHNFIIHYNTGKQIEIELIDMYRKEECACIHCTKLVINEDSNILDKMSNNCYIEVTLDNTILEIIAEKQFRILEIMTDTIAQLPSSISSYPTFLPPPIALPPIALPPISLPPIALPPPVLPIKKNINVDINNVDISTLGIKIINFIDLSD